MFKLHVYSQSGDLDMEVEIEGDTAIIGRSSDCHVVIDRKDISRHHARLLHGWVVDDLTSRNGTHVDGVRIDGATGLGASSFQIGDPTSGNLVTVELVRADRRGAAMGGKEPKAKEPKGKARKLERLPVERPIAPADSASVASLRAELAQEAERYRYKCEKLEVELDTLRRKFEEFRDLGKGR